MLRAGLEASQQVEARNAPSGPPPAAVGLQRDDHNRPVVPLNQPRGNDPDNAWVPSLSRDDQPRCLPQLVRQLPQRRLSLIRHLTLRSPPLPIGPAQLSGNLRRPNLVVG